MRKSVSPDYAEVKQTVVLEDSEVMGDINLPGDLCLFGKISGNIIAKGKVEVKSGAVVTGNISCGELEIEGLVDVYKRQIWRLLGIIITMFLFSVLLMERIVQK